MIHILGDITKDIIIPLITASVTFFIGYAALNISKEQKNIARQQKDIEHKKFSLEIYDRKVLFLNKTLNVSMSLDLLIGENFHTIPKTITFDEVFLQMKDAACEFNSKISLFSDYQEDICMDILKKLRHIHSQLHKENYLSHQEFKELEKLQNKLKDSLKNELENIQITP